MIQPVISKSGYTYIYSSYINSILLSPSENEYVDIDMDKNAYEYYKQKDFFLRENNFFEKKIPNMEIEYDTSCIESELANLNQLLIEVTDECNLSCKYCSYGDLYSNQDERNRGKQEFNNVKILIDYLISLRSNLFFLIFSSREEENEGQICLYSFLARITAQALSQSPFSKKTNAAT